MDFDEYEYLEKTVEYQQQQPQEDDSASKKKARRDEEKEKSERSYRKREDSEEEDEERARSGKKSRRDEEEENGSRRERDRDRDRERDIGRHWRDRDKERELERDRERSREKDRREKERDRDRDREREKEKERQRRERREREKEKEKEREKERYKEKEREKERERRSSSRSRRSSSRSRRDSEREHEREMEREKERELRERERDLEMRESRRYKEKKEMVEPEADPERDQRTVFAYQMPLKASERDVYEFFSKAGKVRDVRLIMDRNSRRSKGVGNAIMMRDDGNTLHSCLINSCCALKILSMTDAGMAFFLVSGKRPTRSLTLHQFWYIEFYDVMSVPMAIALSGQLLLGQPVMVKPSEAEKNLVQSNTSAGSTTTGPYGAIDRKLYVGNLHFNMTEIQLRQLFEPFGPVELVQLPLDIETGQCKGFGFVQFAQLEHAKAAQSALNGKLEIAGRTIKVSSVTDHVGAQDTAAKSADFDDDDGGGLVLNAQSRAMLMRRLDRTGIATSIAGTLGVPMVNGSAVNQQAVSLPIMGQPAVPVPTAPAPVTAISTPASEFIGYPSECLLLKNMFDPATETDPDFDLEIQGDVEEECSKYGRVIHTYVDKNSAGFVYLRFESVEAAASAQRAMHMRWFARRLISAIFMKPQDYEAKFKS